MSSTFMGLETSKRGLTAQQTSLYTVGNNISNANTVGYTRQNVNLVATDGFPSIGMNSPKLAGHLGTGVSSDSITRIRDAFIDKQYRQETNNLGYWSQQTNAISQMEDIVAEPSDYGLRTSFDDFYTAWQNLANSPTSSAARQVVYTKGEHLASSFNYMNTQMTQVQTNLKYEALNTVDNVNTILERIASLNNQISSIETNGYIPNELYDSRDLLLDELSEYMPVTTESLFSGGLAKDAAEGALKVYLVKADGTKQALVSSEPASTQMSNNRERQLYGKSVASKIELMTDTDNGNGIITTKTVSKDDTFEAFSGIHVVTSEEASTTTEIGTLATDATTNDQTITFATFTITAKADGTYTASTGDPVVKNNDNTLTVTDGNNVATTVKLEVDGSNKITNATIDTTTAASTTAVPIRFNELSMQKGSLVSYAASYGYTTITQDANGDDTLSTTGFYYDSLNNLDKLAKSFAEEFNKIHQSGYGISSDGVKNSPTNLSFFSASTGTDITAKTLSINAEMLNYDNIATSSANNQESNNQIALQLSNLYNTSLTSLGNTSSSKFYESIIASIGTQSEKATKMEYNSTSLQLTISNNRDSTSSVSLDEEMTNMVKFQQAYNASARMITVVDETLDKIINSMGRVGL